MWVNHFAKFVARCASSASRHPFADGEFRPLVAGENPIRVRLSRRQSGGRRDLFFFRPLRRDTVRQISRVCSPGPFRSQTFRSRWTCDRAIAKRANKIVLDPQWDPPDLLAAPMRCGRSGSVKLTSRMSERCPSVSTLNRRTSPIWKRPLPPAHVRRPR